MICDGQIDRHIITDGQKDRQTDNYRKNNKPPELGTGGGDIIFKIDILEQEQNDLKKKCCKIKADKIWRYQDIEQIVSFMYLTA